MSNLLSILDDRIPCLGIVFILCSSLFASGGKYFVKLLDLHALIIVMIRCGLMSIVWLFIVAVRRDFLFGQSKKELKLLILRGVLGFLTFSLSYVALGFISLGDTTTIVLSSPIYTTVFAYFFLGERCGPINISLIVLTLAGVVLIARPSVLFDNQGFSEGDETRKLIGTALALCSSIIAALANIVIRKLKETPAAVIVTWFSGCSFLFSSIGIILAKNLLPDEHTESIRPVNLEDEFVIIVLNAICGVFAQLCITLALQVEEAGTISLARSVDIVVSFIFQAILLKHEPIYWTSIVGALVIGLGVTLSAWFKIKEKKGQKENDDSIMGDKIKKTDTSIESFDFNCPDKKI